MSKEIAKIALDLQISSIIPNFAAQMGEFLYHGTNI